MYGGLRHGQAAGHRGSPPPPEAPQQPQQQTAWGLQRMLVGQPMAAAEPRQPAALGPPRGTTQQLQPSAHESQHPLQLAQRPPPLQGSQHPAAAAAASQQQVPNEAALRRYRRPRSPAARLDFGAPQHQAIATPGGGSQQQHAQQTDTQMAPPEQLHSQSQQHPQQQQHPAPQHAASQQLRSSPSQPAPPPQPQQFCSGVFANDEDDEEVLPEDLLLSDQHAASLQQQRAASEQLPAPQHQTAPLAGAQVQHSDVQADRPLAQDHAEQQPLQVHLEQPTTESGGSGNSKGNEQQTQHAPSRYAF